MEIIANSADELFENVKKELLTNPIDDWHMRYEIVNAHLILQNPTKNTMCECSRKMPIRYAIGELLWYTSRNRTAKAISPFSKYWNNLTDLNVFSPKIIYL